MTDLLWPVFDGPDDLAAIEAVPLAERGLPGTTYELLVRAAALWPDRVALSVLPDGERWEHPIERTYTGLLTDVHAYANVFHAHGVRRGDAVALLAPNCDELVHRQRWPPSWRGSPRRSTAASRRRRSRSCWPGPARGSWLPPGPNSPPTSSPRPPNLPRRP